MGPKNQTRKIVKIHKSFELYQVFMYNFLCQTVLIFLIHILVTKIIQTFWSDIWVFAQKIHKDFETIASLQVLNCFKYFLIYISWDIMLQKFKQTISSLRAYSFVPKRVDIH